MIQPLRTAHRRIFIVLAGVLPVILGAGLRVRPHVPLATPDAVTGNQFSVRLSQPTAAWAKDSFDLEFYSEPGGPKGVRIVLKPHRGLNEPDLLLYWTSQASTDAPDLNGANLLGPFRPSISYSLPTGTERGSLVLYSLAHHEIVDVARIKGLP